MNIMKPDFELIALPPHSRQKALTCASFSYEPGENLPAQKEKAPQRLSAPMVLMLGCLCLAIEDFSWFYYF